MKTIVKALIAGVALTAILSSSVEATTPPGTIDQLKYEHPKLPEGFNDEKLAEVVRLDKAATMEQDLHLSPNWSGGDYARAEALRRLTSIREQRHLLSNFTREQMVDHQAAAIVNWFLNDHHVSAHFSEAELIRSAGLQKVIYQQGGNGKAPMGAAEYAAMRGKLVSDRFIEDWHLSEHWSFEELRSVVGPERAATLSQKYGIRAGMSHDQMLAAIGQHETEEYAKWSKISPNFTADEAVQAAGKESLEFIREDYWANAPTAGEINEQWLVRNARIKASYFVDMDFPGLQGNFDEKQLFDYLVKDADDKMRRLYGFSGPYNESDVANAAAESLIGSCVSLIICRPTFPSRNWMRQ
jgi:hypothetical protein